MFVNYLMKQFTIYLGMVTILLLNVMEVFSVDGGQARKKYFDIVSMLKK